MPALPGTTGLLLVVLKNDMSAKEGVQCTVALAQAPAFLSLLFLSIQPLSCKRAAYALLRLLHSLCRARLSQAAKTNPTNLRERIEPEVGTGEFEKKS